MKKKSGKCGIPGKTTRETLYEIPIKVYWRIFTNTLRKFFNKILEGFSEKLSEAVRVPIFEGTPVGISKK